MASTNLSGAGKGVQAPLPPANMPPEPQGQTEEQQQGERPKMSFKSAALKLVSAASAFWMMKRGAPAPPPVLTLDEKEQIQQAFEMLDEDGSGNVGIDEMITAYAMVGIHLTKAAALELVAEVDADGSGEIEFDEFRSLMGRALRPDDAAGGKAAGSGQQPVLKITDMVMALRRKKMLQALEQGGPARAKMVQQADQMIAATQAQARRQKMSTAGGGMAVVRNLMARLANAQGSGGGSGGKDSTSAAEGAAAGPPKMGIMDLIAAAKKARIAGDAEAVAAAGDSTSQQESVAEMALTDVRLSPAVAAAALGVAVAWLAAAAAATPPTYQVQTALCKKGRLPVSAAAAAADPAVTAGTTLVTQGDTQRPRSPSPQAHAAQRQQQHAGACQHTATSASSSSSNSNNSGGMCQNGGRVASLSAAAAGDGTTAGRLVRCLLQQQTTCLHKQQPPGPGGHWLTTAYTSKIRQGARPADLISTAASSSSSSSSSTGVPPLDDAARKPQLTATLKALQQRVPHAKMGRVMRELECRDSGLRLASGRKGHPRRPALDA